MTQSNPSLSSNSARYKYLLDVLWLLLLGVYAFAGMGLAPFHGDEAMHIYTSKDYATAILEGRVDQLPVQPPYDIDSDPRLRLLNGSVMRYSVGLAWHLAGLTVNDLPPAPGWDWGQFYDQNVATGHRPIAPLLTAGRTVAVLYLIGSIIAMFGIGWTFGGRWTAYFVSGLYTLNPIILLNGRRALVESALLCFALFLMLVAFQIARRRSAGEHVGWGWWVGLAVLSALTLASKYSGTIFVAAAFGGVLLVEIVRFVGAMRGKSSAVANVGEDLRPSPTEKSFLAGGFFASIVWLVASGIAALFILIALSPALWNDPVARARDLATMLQEQVDIVVSIQPDAPTTIGQRVEGILTQPFMTTPQQFEQASWADAAPITTEIQAYMASPISGLQFGLIVGGALTLLAGFGLVAAVWSRLHPYESWGLSVVLVMWLLVTIANLLINPLPWQRYYLPLIPITTLLAAIGIFTLIQLFRKRTT
jgi:hypothetical protein